MLEDGSLKLRLCLDLSRHVNKAIKREPCKLATLQTSLALLLPGDYVAVYDLASAYHHVRIREEDQQLLGFAVPRVQRGDGTEDTEEYFVFSRMPFGLATAGQVLDRVLKPIKAKLAQLGIRHSIYIDDGIILGQSRVETAAAVHNVYKVLRAAGFQLSMEKSDTAATVAQTKEYLGFEIHTTNMTVWAPQKKLNGVLSSVSEEIRRRGERRPAKKMSSVIGKALALEPAVGPMVQLLTRAAQ